jgi:[NiFe] hydrogenase assembly HybE family chaperone
MPSGVEPMIEVATIANTLTAAFKRVHRERMVGLPILHPGLSVAVTGARQWRQDWLGMLLTPWCMNLLIVPGPESERVAGGVGSKQVIRFPAGEFEFIGSDEEGIGGFVACSMFSPMQVFADQAAAIATAEAVMVALFEPESAAAPVGPLGGPPGGPQRDEALASAGAGISRRDLLRGRVARRS